MWGDISFWFWFGFPWCLVTSRTSSYTCCPLVCLLWKKCPFRCFAYFSIGLFGCFHYWVVWVLYRFCILILIRYMIWKYFLPFHRLSFHFVDYFFCYAEAFWFNMIPLVNFCMCCLCFWCHTQKIIAITKVSEKAMAPHSSTLAWKILWMEEPGRLQSMGLWRIGQDWATSLSLFTFMHWRRKWQPTPAFLPGDSQGQQSLVGCRLRDHTESDTTEVT